MPDESFISNIVILIHHIAWGSTQNARALEFRVAQAILEVTSRIVMSCGEFMQEYVQKNGDVACKELKILCKNKTPIQHVIEQDKSSSEEYYSSFNLEDALSPRAMASLVTGID